MWPAEIDNRKNISVYRKSYEILQSSKTPEELASGFKEISDIFKETFGWSHLTGGFSGAKDVIDSEKLRLRETFLTAFANHVAYLEGKRDKPGIELETFNDWIYESCQRSIIVQDRKIKKLLGKVGLSSITDQTT